MINGIKILFLKQNLQFLALFAAKKIQIRLKMVEKLGFNVLIVVICRTK